MSLKALKVITLLLVIPIFFQISPPALSPPYDFKHENNVINFGAIFLLLLTLYRAPQIVFSESVNVFSDNRVYMIVFYIMLTFLSLTAGLITSLFIGGIEVSYVDFVQALVFPFTFIIFLSLLQHSNYLDIESLLFFLIFVFGMLNFIYIFQTFIGIGPNSFYSIVVDHIGPFNNFKIKRFYPSAISVILLLQIFYLFLNKNFFKKLIVFIFLISTIFVIGGTWGRSAPVTISFGFLVFILLTSKTVIFKYVIASISALFIFIYLFGGAIFENTFGILRFIETLGQVGELESERFRRIMLGIEEGMLAPFGYMFIYEGKISPENGYLDIATRSGTIGFVIFILFISYFLRDLKFINSIKDESKLDILYIICCMIMFNNIFLNSFTEPYLSIFSGIIFALTARYSYLRSLKNA